MFQLYSYRWFHARRWTCAFYMLLVSIAPIISQPINDQCKDAIDLTSAAMDSLFTCMDGSFEGATPDPLVTEGCNLSPFRTVWYKFRLYSDQMINLHVRSDQLETPIIRMFYSASGSCPEIEIIPIDEFYDEKNYCVVGVDGKAEVIGKILGQGYYYIAISTLDIGPGPFTLCINGLYDVTPCITISPIRINARSYDGPLSGPFFQGEVLSMYAEVWNQAHLSSSCDFFQGLVPVLGTSWDEEFSSPFTEPIDAMLNGQKLEPSADGLYGGHWKWYTEDVNYHVWNENIKLDLFADALAYPALKHALYEPNILSFANSLQPGCCHPCWEFGGSILPPGWFCEGNHASCNMDGRVRYKYGDGLINCEPFQGPWNFTFSLPVNNYIPDCSTNGDLELYLSLYSFTDGVIGSYYPFNKCVNDPYAFRRFPVVCNEIQGDPMPIEYASDFACPGDTIIIALDSLIPASAGVAYWSYELDQPNMQLASSGFLLSGDSLVFMENPGGGQAQSFSGWLQAYRSARELLGRFRINVRFLILPKASFTWQVTGSKVKFTGPIGDHATYHWDFGDGDTSIVQSPMHTYLKEGKYLVELIVSNKCGADTLQKEIYFIYQKPDASFIVPDTVICRNDSITFSSSFDGIIDSLIWNFQGGSPASSHESVVTVTYADTGWYDVSLSIYNPLGVDTQVKTQAVEVKDKADLNYTVWVHDSLIYLIYLGEADSVTWEIGDFYFATGDTAQYVFEEPGIYPATLTVGNVCGQDSLQFNIEILKTAVQQAIDGNEILLYPNPTKESIYIHTRQDLHAARIWLQDMSGHTVYRMDDPIVAAVPLVIDLKSLDLPSGVYILNMSDHNRFVQKKIVFIQ